MRIDLSESMVSPKAAIRQSLALSIMLCCGSFAWAAQVEVSSSKYLQRGLLCHFDALDNAGRGVHSSSTTTWVDLTGNGNDATVHFTDESGNPLKGFWGGRALSSCGAADGVYADFVPSTALRTLVNSDGPWTIEFVDTMDFERKVTDGCIEFGTTNVFGMIHKGAASDFRGYFYVRSRNTSQLDSTSACPPGKQTIPRTITYVHTGTKIIRYRNGVAEVNTAAPTGGPRPLGENVRLQILYHLVGDMMSVRVYNRELTADERKYNMEIDRDRFFFRDARGLSADESGDAAVLNVKVTAKCPDGSGTVSINGDPAGTSVEKTVAFGSSVTLTFAPADGYAASGWANLPVGTDTLGASVTFTASQTVSAHVLTDARTVHYVSKSGDNADDGSQAHPWRSIQHAVANSAVREFDEIRVQGGLYEECVMLSPDAAYAGSRHRLTIVGSYDGIWTRDLENSRTVIRPAAHSGLALQDFRSYSNVVDGVDLTGARIGYGFSDNLAAATVESRPTAFSTLLRHCIVTNNYSHGTAAFGESELVDQPCMGIRCTSCLIANNGGWGYGTVARDTQGGQRLFTNCTIANNAQGGLKLQISYNRGACYCRNVILANNGGAQLWCDSEAQYGLMRLLNCIVHRGSGVAFSAKTATEAGDNSTSSVIPIVPVLGETYEVDPLLDSSFCPIATSYANKSGMDADAIAAAPAVDDVYGRAWSRGAYDLGCFRTSHPLPATRRSLSDVYVAADGDDGADGSSSHPLATLGEALWRVKPEGTCHVGPGTYLAQLRGVYAQGVRIVGDDCGRTVFAGVGLDAGSEPSLYLAATNVVLTGCVFSNATYGIVNVNVSGCGKIPVMTNCVFRGNRIGYRQCGTAWNTGKGEWLQRFTRCRFLENTFDGLWTNARVLLDSCLVADNGRYGYYHNGEKNNGMSMIMNCTVAGNGSCGLYKLTGNNGGLSARNSVIAKQTCGVNTGGGNNSQTVNWQYTLFDNDTNQSGTLDGMTASCITDRPCQLRGGKDVEVKYRLTDESPAVRAGSWQVYPWSSYAPARDLDGVVWRRKLDMGCYVRPAQGLMMLIN